MSMPPPGTPPEENVFCPVSSYRRVWGCHDYLWWPPPQHHCSILHHSGPDHLPPSRVTHPYDLTLYALTPPLLYAQDTVTPPEVSPSKVRKCSGYDQQNEGIKGNEIKARGEKNWDGWMKKKRHCPNKVLWLLASLKNYNPWKSTEWLLQNHKIWRFFNPFM